MRALLIRAAAALVAFASATAASAQDVPNVISPLRVESDHNGVNLVSGKMMMEGPTLSAPGAGNLHFDRVQNAAPYVLGKISGQPGEYVQGNYTVHTGQGTDAFHCDDDVCYSVTGTGSGYLINVNTFTQAGSGAVWRFNLKHVKTTTSNPNTIQYYASSVTYPNGETISYSYNTTTLPGDTFNRTWYRPTQLTSSLGYTITITYQYTGTDLTNPYWGSPSVVTLYKIGDSNPIGRLTYSGGTVTDLGGRVYSCSGCSNALGAQLETTSGSLTLPGEGSAAVQATAHSTGQVVQTVVKDGVTWTYTYLNLRLGNGGTAYVYDRLTVDGPNGFHQVYDMSGSNIRNVIVRSTDPIGRATNYTFDEAYRPTQIVYPEGNKVNVGYDNFGNIISRTATPKVGSGLTAATETAFYPSDDWNLCNGTLNQPRCYRPLWSRDALGRQTDYVWNDQGQLIEQTDPADQNGVRRKTYITYETGGLSRKSVVRVCGTGAACGTANEIRTEYTYWGSTFLPALERKIDAAQGVTLDTVYTYDPAGRPLSVDGPLPGTDDATYILYDPFGRKSWEIGPRAPTGLRIAKKFSYRNSDDRLVSTEEGTVTDPANPVLAPATRTDFSYDAHRNAVREAVSASGTTFRVLDKSFDDRGQLICEARRMNPAAFGQAPGACAFATHGSQGPDRITRNIYDAAGQLLTVQKAYGVTTANGFPATLQQDYARYEYTPNGKQKAVIDANGNRAEMTWDGHDRQRRWIFPSKTVTGSANQADYEEYGYDSVGNRTSLRKRDGTTLTFQFDALNRMTVKSVPTSVTGAAGYSVFSGYEARGLQTYARFGSAAGVGITNAYDGFGRLTSSTTNMDGVNRTFNSQYDAGSRRIVLSSPSDYYASFAYDALGRLTAYKEGATPVVQLGYDAMGRRSSLVTAAGSTSSATFGRDSIGRLSSITRELAGTAADQALTFAYNPASQVTTRTSSNDSYASNTAYTVSRGYSVNGLNQYTAAGPAAFLYDANGNLTWDGSTSFVYDGENRLVSASGAKTASLGYDPLGRLWQTSGGASGTTRFVYDGDKLVEEYDGAGNRPRVYVHGTGSDEPLVLYELTGGPVHRFYHTDHQGSIVALADDSGNALAINAYDPWGIPNAGNYGRFGYTGQAWIADLGMYYYKARFYSPTLGRFMQTDPVGYKDQVNLYAYAGNDPLNSVDPTGKCHIDPETKVQTGICGTGDNEKIFVERMLHNRKSDFSKVEKEAIAKGNLINLTFVRNDRTIDGAGTEAGAKPGDSEVYIDVGETVRMDNLDSSGKVTDSRMATTEELAEHEVVGHAADAVRNPEAPRGRDHSNEQNAIDKENAFRDRAGIPFHRNYPPNFRGVMCDSRGQCPQ